MNKYAKHLLAVLVMVALMCTMMVMPAFAEEPDANTGTYAAQIGGTGYPTFDEALTAAAAMTGDVTIEIYDKVTLNKSLSGSYDSIKFVGKDTDAEIYLDVQGYITATGKKVAFEGLILSKSAGGFITNAGFMNVAFGVYEATEVTYTKCTFSNGAYASSGKVTFTGCTFKRSHDKYGLWAYGSNNIIVDNCTFADYRGIKMYDENKGANNTTGLTVKNSNFSAVNDKPAIVLTYGKSVTLEGNTYSSTGVFELDLDGAPNGTPVTSDVAPTCKNDNGACGVMVDGKIYTTVAQAAQAASSGSTVTLLHDSTETVALPEGVSLDKNGHTADGVTATNPAATVNGNMYASLEAAVKAAESGQPVTLLRDASGSGMVINKDLTIDFGTHSYTFTEPAVGSSGTESNGFQILSGNTVTLLNGALNVHADHASKYYMLIQNYADLTLSNMKLDGTNLDKYSATDGDSYVLSNNCGTINMSNTTITANDAGDKAYAFDVCKYASYTAPTVTATNCTVTGTVDVCGGTLTVTGGKYAPASQCTDAFIVSSGSLTIGGDVTVTGGKLNQSTAIWAKDTGKVTINGGTYTITEPVDASVEQGYNDLIYARDSAVVEINGGNFSGPARTSDNQRFLLNLKDNSAARFIVKGGSFKGFNPQQTGTEPAGVKDNFVADGYGVVVTDDTWTVHEHKICGVTNETHHWNACDVTGCEYKSGEAAHSFVEDLNVALLKSEATCTSPAVYYKGCSSCAYNNDETFTHGTALGHSMTHHEKVAATCTEDGNVEYYYCATCEKNFSDEAGTKELATIVDPALGHDKVLVNEVKATCTVDGTMAHYDCSRCDAVFFTAEGQEQTTADKLVIKASHAWTPAFDATSHLEYCTACEATQNKEDHSFYEEWVPASDYHCHMCEICGYETDKAEHGKFVEKQDLAYLVSANDCVEFYFKQCEVCGKAGSEDDLFTVARTDAAHVWGEGTVTTPATCTTAGVKTFSCTTKGCTATHTEEIQALGHTLKTVAAVEATYFAPGNIEHSACAVCSKLFDAEGKELTAADVVIAQLIKVEDNKADVSTDVIDNAIKESETEGKVDIVINVTKDKMADEETAPDGGTTEPAPAPVVTTTELPVAALDKVADVSSEATLTVSMTTATVTLDNKTLEVIAEEAKTAGSDVITLEIEHIETKELNEKQQEAVEDLEVAVTISASILSNGKEIHDFKGGNVTVAVPFTPAEGTKGSDYTVYYVADDGKVTKVPTSYSNGALVFSIGHFSEYIVVNTNVVEEDVPTNGTPATGDTTDVILLGSVMILSLAMTAAMVMGKKKFNI